MVIGFQSMPRKKASWMPVVALPLLAVGEKKYGLALLIFLTVIL